MQATVKYLENNRFLGTNSLGMQTYYDNNDGEFVQTAPTPMEVVLQAMGACSAIDIISIIKKKRKQVADLEVKLDADRRDDYPKTFTNIRVKYILTSPDAEEKDLIRAVELSQEKYCNVSIMLKDAGVNLTWEAELVRS
jgi:putative redox protein